MSAPKPVVQTIPKPSTMASSSSSVAIAKKPSQSVNQTDFYKKLSELNRKPEQTLKVKQEPTDEEPPRFNNNYEIDSIVDTVYESVNNAPQKQKLLQQQRKRLHSYDDEDYNDEDYSTKRKAPKTSKPSNDKSKASGNRPINRTNIIGLDSDDEQDDGSIIAKKAVKVCLGF